MADFRKLTMDLCLAGGRIDEGEVKVLKKGLYQDGKIDRKEVEFVIELRGEAQRRAKGEPLSDAFENFFVKAVYDGVTGNGILSAKELTLLRKAVRADGKLDGTEKKLLKKVKGGVEKTPPAFDRFFEECMA